MFTGIIENIVTVENIEWNQSNMILTLKSNLSAELYIDQSIAHNGACLTITDVQPPFYKVTLIEETLNKTNFKSIHKGDIINIERSMKATDRLDGHFVTGHIDTIGKCRKISDKNGSKEIIIEHQKDIFFTTIPKGSITINGISLTVVESAADYFSTHIIPYTWEHTNLNTLKEGSLVNIEFDMIGKYIAKYIKQINLNQ